MEAQRIIFSFVDATAGYEASPQRLRLHAMAEFATDVETFLRGDTREVDTSTLDVAVISGSFAIQTAPVIAAPKLFTDLESLVEGELLDNLDAKRRAVVSRWQKTAQGTPKLSYRIHAPFMPRAAVISSESDFRANDADQWVQVERYIRGEVQDLGGSTKANAHIRLPNGALLTVAAEKETLQKDTINRLYKSAMLRIRARYNVLTQELKDARLIEFVEYKPSLDEGEIAKLTRRGEQAWKDIADATHWVDELRGGKD